MPLSSSQSHAEPSEGMGECPGKGGAVEGAQEDEGRLKVLASFALGGQACLDSLRPDWSVMLDSGAFTNWSRGREVVTVNGYMAFLLEHGHRFSGYLNFDRIGDPAESAANLAYLQGLGLSPIPVFQRGGPRSELEGLLADHDLVAVGGISKSPQAKAERDYLRQVMAISRGHRVHLLGVGDRPIAEHRPWSADCATYNEVQMYGRLRLWHGSRWIVWKKGPRDRKGRHSVRPDLSRTAALRAYGLSWNDLRDPEAWKRTGRVCIAGIRGWIRFARYAQERLGSHLVFVDHSRAHPALAMAWEQEDSSWH